MKIILRSVLIAAVPFEGRGTHAMADTLLGLTPFLFGFIVSSRVSRHPIFYFAQSIYFSLTLRGALSPFVSLYSLHAPFPVANPRTFRDVFPPVFLLLTIR